MCYLQEITYKLCPHTMSHETIPCCTFPLLQRCVNPLRSSDHISQYVRKIKGNKNYCENCYENAAAVRLWRAVDEAEFRAKEGHSWTEARAYQEIREFRSLTRSAMLLTQTTTLEGNCDRIGGDLNTQSNKM